MESEVVTIGWVGGFVLLTFMTVLTFLGMYINKPFPWEKRLFDKDNVKYKDGDNT
jgi:hypothetical protein